MQVEEEFQNFLKTIEIVEEKFYVSFDDNGMLQELSTVYGPTKIEIDTEIAESIYSGKENLQSYKIDLSELKLVKNKELVYNSLTKIDDVLHRIVEKKWSKVEKPDVSVLYERSLKTATFRINPLLKTVSWLGDRELVFLFTEYNDPNILLGMFKFSVDELISYPQKFEIELPEKFSIYTRRIFSNYTLEVE